MIPRCVCHRYFSTQSYISSVSTKVQGTVGTKDYRQYFQKNGTCISPWHDIPIRTASESNKPLYHAIIEISKMTKAKMEVAMKEENNPIVQDIKKEKLREYHGPIFWNYGMIPQTWEDPEDVHSNLKVSGDNDPVDIVEIGSSSLRSGSIIEFKPLGALAMIDDGELDWKIIGIDTEDSLASQLHCVDDIRRLLPGTISGIREWFRWYKTPDGKPLNAFGYNEKCLQAEDAIKILDETHLMWKALYDGKVSKFKLWIP